MVWKYSYETINKFNVFIDSNLRTVHKSLEFYHRSPSTFINFSFSIFNKDVNRIEDFYINVNEREKSYLILDNVTTMKLSIQRGIQDTKEYLINVLPNLNYLILSSTDLSSKTNQLAEIFNKRIQWLDIDANSKLVELSAMSYVYFSNFKLLYGHFQRSEWYENIITNILKNY